MVDQEGADVLAEMETYANAGSAPMMGRPAQQQRPVDDERMPEEWNRARNKEGDVVGFMGQRPIVRSIGIKFGSYGRSSAIAATGKELGYQWLHRGDGWFIRLSKS